MSKRAREDGVSSKEKAYVDRAIQKALKGPQKYHEANSGVGNCSTVAQYFSLTDAPPQTYPLDDIDVGTGADERLSPFIRVSRIELDVIIFAPGQTTTVRTPGYDVPIQDYVITAGWIMDPALSGRLSLYPSDWSRPLGGAVDGIDKRARPLRYRYTKPASYLPDPWPYRDLQSKSATHLASLRPIMVTQLHAERDGSMTNPSSPTPITTHLDPEPVYNGEDGKTYNYMPVVKMQEVIMPKIRRFKWQFGGQGLPVQFADGSGIAPKNRFAVLAPATSATEPSTEGGQFQYQIRVWFSDEV